MNPFLTIMILTKNCEEHILRCFNSIVPLLQFVVDIVVVDDVSTDKTVEYVEAIKQKYKLPITVISKEKKEEGFAGQRNAAIENAKGSWILILDSDETVSPSMFWELMPMCQTTNVIAWYFPRILLFPDDKHYMVDAYPDFQMRLFRKYEGVKFTRPVHEYLVRTDEHGKEISLGIGQPNTKITKKLNFMHYQLLTSEDKLTEKAKRWMDISQESRQAGFEIIGEDAFKFKENQNRIALLPQMDE